MAGKTRVGELAKELGIAPKLIIDQLEAMGQKEKTSSSAIDDTLLPMLRDALQEKAAAFAQRETERLDAARTAALRAKVEEAKARAAKAARTRAKKADATAKPKAPAKAKPVVPKAERPGAAVKKAGPVSPAPAPRVEEKVVKPLPERVEPVAPAAAA